MNYYWRLLALMVTIFSLLFGLVVWLDIGLLTDPTPWLGGDLRWAAIGGVALLVADVALPVPASLVMVANGALFGVFGGTLLSLLGSLGASWFGFYLGRRGGPLLARFIPETARVEADQMIRKQGIWAVMLTRPVPLLSESVALIAGTTQMSWNALTLASLGGSLPAAALYAITGATSTRLDNAFLIFGLVMAITGIAWLWQRRAAQRIGAASPR